MRQFTITQTGRQRIPEIGVAGIFQIEAIDLIEVASRVCVKFAFDIHHQRRSPLGPVAQNVHVEGGGLAGTGRAEDASVGQELFQRKHEIVRSGVQG